MTNCATCDRDYDETNEAAVKRHDEPVNCSQTSRCHRCYGKPECYTCEGHLCFCMSH